jgi:hypothetical protein
MDVSLKTGSGLSLDQGLLYKRKRDSLHKPNKLSLLNKTHLKNKKLFFFRSWSRSWSGSGFRSLLLTSRSRSRSWSGFRGFLFSRRWGWRSLFLFLATHGKRKDYQQHYDEHQGNYFPHCDSPPLLDLKCFAGRSNNPKKIKNLSLFKKIDK